jgi:KDO2-lipid IV(A) lauroyltransferase
MTWVYLYPVRGLSHLLPVSVLLWATQLLAPAYARLRRDFTGRVSRKMTNFLEGRDMPESAEIMAQSFVARGMRRSVDDLVMRRLDNRSLQERATIHGIEYLDEALAEGNGAIVISGHFNANRLAKYYLRRNGYPLMSVRDRKPGDLRYGRIGKRHVAPAWDRFLEAIIEDEICVHDSGLGAGLLRRLRENGIINIHIDAARSSERFRVGFLNQERRFPGGFLRIAELTAAPLVPMQCLGNSSDFEINFEAPIRYAGKSSPEDAFSRLMPLVGQLESWVLTHPTQWEQWRPARIRAEK